MRLFEQRDIDIEAVKNHQSKNQHFNQEVLTNVVTETIEGKNEKLIVSPVTTGGPRELPTETKEVPYNRLFEDNCVTIRGNEKSKSEEQRKRA